jgi:uncharacterized membrane protein
MTLLAAFLIGFCAGLRSLTPPAAAAWAVYLKWFKLDYPLAYIGSFASVAILSALAAIELIADKLPQTPNRTSPPGLIARNVTGGFAGACIAAGAGQGIFLGAMVGAAGGVVGCFAGYHARSWIVKTLGTRDVYVALIEDLVAIAGSIWVVSRF